MAAVRMESHGWIGEIWGSRMDCGISVVRKEKRILTENLSCLLKGGKRQKSEFERLEE